METDLQHLTNSSADLELHISKTYNTSYECERECKYI